MMHLTESKKNNKNKTHENILHIIMRDYATRFNPNRACNYNKIVFPHD